MLISEQWSRPRRAPGAGLVEISVFGAKTVKNIIPCPAAAAARRGWRRRISHAIRADAPTGVRTLADPARPGRAKRQPLQAPRHSGGSADSSPRCNDAYAH